MYRILYIGQNSSDYSRLKDSLPIYMKLEPQHERINLQSTLRSVKLHGIILPISNPGPDDFFYLKKIIGTPRVPGVIVTSNYLTAAQAVSCMRFGAYDCITGPVSGEVVVASLSRMIQPIDHDTDEKEFEKPTPEPFLAGNSSAVTALRNRLLKYSEMPYPVLITGETGSGKELAAKTLHYFSNRREKPFTAVNCASYSDDLLESEMFGSLKGAFTGSTDRPGLFEASRGGTLFLDEIGELSLRGQASLLRVIEDGYIRRMGSHRTKAVDVRIITATNKDLRKHISLGTFRNDLFYRINLLGVTVPPLRKRIGDIQRLSRDYLNNLPGDTVWKIEKSALSILIRHNWPGNVRELQSVLLKASITAENGRLRASDLCILNPEEEHQQLILL